MSAFPKHDAPTQPPITFIASSDSEVEPENDNRMALNHFAYQNPSRIQSKVASLSRTGSIAVVDNPATDSALKPKDSRNAGQHRFAGDFSDAELRRLAKCVCCGISWTTRKGVAQKMVHVQSCAKKNAFTDATVKILIRREVDKALAENQAAKTKGKGKAVDLENLLPEIPKTFMDDIVQGAEPGIKRRRLGDQTVKSGKETRLVILDKAKGILGSHVVPNTQDVDERRFQTQEFGPSRLVDQLSRDAGAWKEPQPTQSFGKSALRQRPATDVMLSRDVRKRAIFDAGASDYEVDIPSTQNFGPSKLAGLYQAPAFGIQHGIDSPLIRDSLRLVRTFCGIHDERD
jgi:hypothetical protein